MKIASGGHQYVISQFSAFEAKGRTQFDSSNFQVCFFTLACFRPVHASQVGGHKWLIECRPKYNRKFNVDLIYFGPSEECYANWRLT